MSGYPSIAACAAALFAVIQLSPAANAADSEPNVSAGDSSFQVSITDANTAPSAPSDGPEGPAVAPVTAPVHIEPGHYVTVDVCNLNGEPACGDTCPDGSIKTVTYFLPEVGQPTDFEPSCPGPTTVDVEHAFKEIPMQPSVIHVQPPGGETLVNFDSVFFTDPFTQDVTKRPLGVPVAFHITVQKYIWHFGDGGSVTTTDPGAAYPNQTIVHRYLTKGPVSVTLETVFQADYSIDGGPQTHLADTVTRVSAPQRLTVLTATPHLVAE